MRFYKQPHRFYSGALLHARCLYLCILDPAGPTVLHRDLAASADVFLDAVAPYRDGLDEPATLNARTGRRRGTAEFLGRDEELVRHPDQPLPQSSSWQRELGRPRSCVWCSPHSPTLR